MIPSSGATPTAACAPVGVFDSGIGGLSVLRHIQALLPQEQLLYFADTGHAPYGGKSEAEVAQRALAVAAFLLEHKVKAMVVACNTATAAAIDAIRSRYPGLVVVGVEPGLKPAASATRSGKIGVLATEGTLASQRFATLRAQVTATNAVEFLLMPCPGLADQVEKGELRSLASATLVQRFVAPLVQAGADTLVLGCTHYPFLLPLIRDVANNALSQTKGEERAAPGLAAASEIKIIDTGEAVARQLQRVLTSDGLLCDEPRKGKISAFTSGSDGALTLALSRLLGLNCRVQAVTEK